MIARVLCLFALAFSFAAPAAAWDNYIGRNMDVEVASVPDGNVLTVKNDDGKKLSISFYGIGIPTKRQPYGAQAHDYLAKTLPPGAKATLTTINEDDEGIISALVQVADESINTRLVASGLAWVDRKTCKALFCRRMHIAENTAREERLGIWGLNMSTPPWQWGEQNKKGTSND